MDWWWSLIAVVGTCGVVLPCLWCSCNRLFVALPDAIDEMDEVGDEVRVTIVQPTYVILPIVCVFTNPDTRVSVMFLLKNVLQFASALV